MVQSQKELIHGTNWDVLIILDACRFDVFEEVYDDYLEGDLRKVESEGSNTKEWLYKTFPDFYDIDYYSANPFINSLGLSLTKIADRCEYDYLASDHFSNIIDLWESEWNEEEGTVLPIEMNKAVLNGNRGGRKILHYIQPHEPYLFFDKESGSWFADHHPNNEEKNKNKNKTGLLNDFVNFIGRKRIWWIKKLIGLPPTSAADDGFRKGDILYHYRKNLNKVLEAVTELVENLDGEIIITADHGEAFGEGGIWGHPSRKNNSILKKVPWFEVSL